MAGGYDVQFDLQAGREVRGMGNRVDLKIELTKLYSLHWATVKFEHGIKELNNPKSLWQDFAPLRFIYAFFTFNTIYSIDWEASFENNRIIYWEPDNENKYPKEEEQIKSYIRFLNKRLITDVVREFQKKIRHYLNLFNINDPQYELRYIKSTNETKKLKNLREQFPGKFNRLLTGKPEEINFLEISNVLFPYIYKIRCNLFHGSKTRIQLMDENQQQRLLIYAALIITANEMLFGCAKEIGWRKVNCKISEV